MGSNHHHHNRGSWVALIKEETLCHLPYALVSVVIGIIGVGILTHVIPSRDIPVVGHQLFHVFHYLHLLFAGAGVILSFRSYSSRVIPSLVIGFCVPSFFCTLSDAIIPYFGGKVLKVSMHFHWCFRDHFLTVIPFLASGIALGWAVNHHAKKNKMYFLLFSHISHILISSMASTLYLVTFGFLNIWSQVHMVFLFLLVAVLVPCTLSDVVVPILFAKGACKDHTKQ